MNQYTDLLYICRTKIARKKEKSDQILHEQTGWTRTLEQFQAVSLLYTPDYLARYQLQEKRIKKICRICRVYGLFQNVELKVSFPQFHIQTQ